MRIRTTGLKAHDINIELGERTLLAGPCGSGKSSVLDAIRWTILGYVPSYGKTRAATAALMRGREMAATLTLDDGRTVTRELRRGKNDSLAQSVRCSWVGEKATSDEHEAAALALVGGDAERAAELLDVRQLLADTGPRRTASLQRLLAAGEMDARERLQIVAEQTVRRLTGTEDRGDLTLAVLIPLVPGSGQDGAPHSGVRAILKGTQDELRASLADGAGSAKAWATSEKNRAARETKEKRAALAEIEARLSEVAEVDEATLAADEARLREIDEAIGAAKARADQATAINQRIAAADTRLREAGEARDFSNLEARIAAADASDGADEKRARIGAIDAELAAIEVGEPDYSDADRFDSARDAAVAKARETDQPSAPPRLLVERAQDALEAAEQALARAESDPWCQVVESARSIDAALASIPRVPDRLVKHVGSITAELITLAEAQGWGDEAALRDAVDAAKAALAVEQATYDEALRDYSTRREAHIEAVREADAATGRAAEVRRQIADRHKQATAAARERKSTLGLERAELATWIADAERTLSQRRGNLARAEQAFADAQEARDALGSPVTADAPDTTDRDALAADIASRRKQSATRSELQALSRDLERLGAEREVYAAIEWACARCQEIEVERAGGVLRDPMRQFLADAGRWEVPFLEASGGDTRIGWVRPDGSPVPVAAMCGGEWPVFVAALSAAMHGIIGAELPLLLLEAGETDDAHLGHILGGIAATRGVRAVVAVQRHVTAVPRWRVVDTGRADSAATEAAA